MTSRALTGSEKMRFYISLEGKERKAKAEDERERIPGLFCTDNKNIERGTEKEKKLKQIKTKLA